jgi:hypothetical protein
VPHRHRVEPVAAISPVQAIGSRSTNGDAGQSSDRAKLEAKQRHTARSAAPGFAAHILVEADLAGPDPFAQLRSAKAYQSARPVPTQLKLVA